MSTYYTQYDAIVSRYSGLIASTNETYTGYASTINDEYDGYKTTIESKEITEQYTLQDQQDELAANESARTSALAANETARTNAVKRLNEQKQAELVQLNAQYTEDNENLRVDSIDYDYILNKIENLDFSTPAAPTYTQQELANISTVMAAVPETVYNTKYIYLTFQNKYEALEQLSTQEHETYSSAYDSIVETYMVMLTRSMKHTTDTKQQSKRKK